MKQLSLPVIIELADCSEFLVSRCNQDAYKLLIEQHTSHQHITLIGSRMSGKTRLAKLWYQDGLYIDCQKDQLDFMTISGYSRIAIDNFHLSNECELFHIINRCNDYGINLLLVSNEKHNFMLPDLVSRLNSSLQLRILAPDNAFCVLVIQELSIIHRIKLTNTVLDYISRRIHFDDFINLWQFRIELKHACDINKMVLDIEIFRRIYDNWHWL